MTLCEKTATCCNNCDARSASVGQVRTMSFLLLLLDLHPPTQSPKREDISVVDVCDHTDSTENVTEHKKQNSASMLVQLS
jgi:hypothetical protein